MEFHEAANIFPLDEEHIEDLAEDIQKHGQQVPIEVFQGKILDGRRRFLACELASVQPITKNVCPTDPVAYVLSLNLHRRHLSASQLAMVAARVREIYDQQAKERQRTGGKEGGKGRPKQVMEPVPQPNKGLARDNAGKAVGVCGRTVDFATKVLKSGVPELIEAVDQGTIYVRPAADIASLPEEKQRQELKLSQSKPKAPKEKNGDEEPPEVELRGVGIFRANEAIDCLKRIPKNDALRKRGFQVVTDWIKANR